MHVADLFDVSGRVSVVIGAASAVALSCAHVLADNRARVSVVDADQTLLDRLGRTPGLERADLHCADVMRADALRAVLARIEEVAGQVDIAIISAIPEPAPWIGAAGRSIDAIDPALWQQHVDAGLSAAYVALGAVVPAMKARRRGSIVVATPPGSSSTGRPRSAALAAIAAGTGHLVRQVALELAGSGVRVNAMAVAAAAGGPSEDRNARPGLALEQEIEALALYLASDASSYMTGIQLTMDGGAGLGVAGSRS